MLPISVLLPTRDSGALLAGHLPSMEPWLDLVEEVVVVDSHSKDDTLERIRRGLAHPRVRILSHPPGLYQSWNFGIQQARGKYLYISTVGDAISRDGLEHLLAVAERLQSDVVISKPRFIGEAGEPRPDDRWPIDEILDGLAIKSPQGLTTGEQFIFATVHTWGAILGSSASNLYRTACLAERPFPVEFGTSGDGGWGIANMFDVKIAVTPERFSFFRHHEKTYSLADYRVDSRATKLFRLAQQVIAQKRASDPAVRQILEAACWTELEPALETALKAQDTLEELRHRGGPWVLKPRAWQARRRRQQARNEINALVRRFLAQREPY